MQDDGRADQARMVPIMDLVHRLNISGLAASGVEHEGPCPVCGGTDRFSVHPKRNLWRCRQCPGTGGQPHAGGRQIDLVMFTLGCSFPEALDYIVGERDIALDPAKAARRKEVAARAEEKTRREAENRRQNAINDARRIWHAVSALGLGRGTLADDYLAARGVTFEHWPPTLAFCPNLPYEKHFPGKGFVTWFTGPALVAAAQNPAGRVTAVHRTWLDPDEIGKKRLIVAPDGSTVDGKGKKYPAKVVRGSKRGAAIRLTRPNPSGLMIMGEGIETTGSVLSSGVHPSATYWVGIDLGHMAGRQIGRNSGVPDMDDHDAFIPPDWVQRLMYLEDGAETEAKTKATRAKLTAGLRRAAARRPGLVGGIVPAPAGKDMNDLRMEQIRNDNRD